MKLVDLEEAINKAGRDAARATSTNDEMAALITAVGAVGVAIVAELKAMNQHLEYMSVQD